MRLRPFALLVLLSCRKDPPPPAPIDAAAPAVARDAATASRDAAPPTAAQLAGALRDLQEGRKLSRAKDWSGALAAFDRALAVSPDDARILSEVGWAAFQANDLRRAETASARALANAKEPAVRAPILYNAGRVAEARGNRAAARKAYAESLALRENAEVRKRLAEVRGDAGAEPADTATLPMACEGGFDDMAAFCKCLLVLEEDGLFPSDTKRTCTREITSGPLGDGRLTAVVWGPEALGERLHILLAREGDKVRAVAELGRDYEPGAFGVHNSAFVQNGQKRTVNGHTVVVVKSVQSDNDTNMAGLELCVHHAKQETVCALGDTPGATRCAMIPVEIESGCGPGVELDPKELDEDTRWAVAELKKQKHTFATASWALGDDGTMNVTVNSGPRDFYDARTLAPHILWR